MKKLFCVLLVLLLLPVAAGASTAPRLTDDGDLLSSGEERELLEKLDEISRRQNFDVVIITVAGIPEGYTVRDYADDCYDYSGFRQDGCLLLISMEQRDWYISTCGFGITALTDAGIQYIGEQLIDSGLSDGDYLNAFLTYARLCDEFVTRARTGDPYDVGNLPKEKTPWALITVIALALGCGMAFIPVTVMKSQMKPVRQKRDAGDYVQRNSLTLSQARDVFLYRNLTRTEIPKDTGSNGGGGSSIHTSSSGASHGGGGGTF